MILLEHLLAEQEGQHAAGHTACPSKPPDLWHLPGTLTVINPPAIGSKSVTPCLQSSGIVH